MMKFLRKLKTYAFDIVFMIINLVLWFNMDELLLRLDPTSAIPSGEFLAKFVFAAFGLFSAHTIVKIIMLFGWPVLDRLMEGTFAQHVNRLAPWEQIKISFTVFCLYFLSFVLLVMAM